MIILLLTLAVAFLIGAVVLVRGGLLQSYWPAAALFCVFASVLILGASLIGDKPQAGSKIVKPDELSSDRDKKTERP